MSFRMLMVLALAVMSLVVATASQAVLLSDFESPIYTAGATFTNVDGWNQPAFAPGIGKGFATPDPGNSGYTGPALDGAQSGVFLQYLQHPWGSLQNLVVTNSLQVTWLMNLPYGYSRSGIYLSTDFAAGATTLGIYFDSLGNIRAYAPDSGDVDTGLNYETNKTYRLSMWFDFAAHQMVGYAQNVTDSGPMINLGTYATGTINLTNLRNNGLFVRASDAYTLFDDIQVVPEPTSALLLALGGLLLHRRFRAR